MQQRRFGTLLAGWGYYGCENRGEWGEEGIQALRNTKQEQCQLNNNESRMKTTTSITRQQLEENDSNHNKKKNNNKDDNNNKKHAEEEHSPKK